MLGAPIADLRQHSSRKGACGAVAIITDDCTILHPFVSVGTVQSDRRATSCLSDWWVGAWSLVCGLEYLLCMATFDVQVAQVCVWTHGYVFRITGAYWTCLSPPTGQHW